MATIPHVALIVETAKQYDRGLLAGIGRYIRKHGPWSVYLEERGPQDGTPSWLKTWQGHGVIARIKDEAMAAALTATGAPVVELRRQVITHNFPAIHCDDAAISALALAHFRERGFREFAYCGRPGERWSDLREAAFHQCVADAGHACHLYRPSRQASAMTWEQEQDDVARWIATLPQPVAVLACNDIRGLQVLDACRRTDLPVPEGVAVLGVDNDVVLSELADPPLSSTDQDLERIGYEAAALLDRLMGGEPAPSEPILIKPTGIVARRSTDSVAIDDPAVATALRLVRQHACDGHGVAWLADRAGISVRSLQRRFSALTGRTLQDEILDARLARVRRLLAETDLKLDAIARKTAFHYIGYMGSLFKKRTGMTPGEYRRLHRRSPSTAR